MNMKDKKSDFTRIRDIIDNARIQWDNELPFFQHADYDYIIIGDVNKAAVRFWFDGDGILQDIYVEDDEKNTKVSMKTEKIERLRDNDDAVARRVSAIIDGMK